MDKSRWTRRIWPAVLAAGLLTKSAAVPIFAEPFRGESCQVCHASIRDAGPRKPGLEPEARETFDVAVIGGGLSGLSAAHYLKDLKVILFEKEDKIGGKARREWFDRWAYPVGAVYTALPHGKLEELFNEFGLKLLRFRRPIHAFWSKEGIVWEWISREGILRFPYPPGVLEKFKKLIDRFEEVESNPILNIPVQESDFERLKELDGKSFWDYLEAEFGREAAQLGDYHAQDVFGTTSREVSAAVGLMYMAAEITDSYSWPGGLGPMSEAFVKDLDSRIQLRTLVDRVVPLGEEVEIFFRKGKDRGAVRARAVILAVPAMVTRRIALGLSKEKDRALGSVRYSSYVLVPMKLRKPIYRDSFVLWTPGRFFLDLTFSGGERLEGFKGPSTGQVAVAYIPLGASNRERRWLLKATDEEIRKRVLTDLEIVLPGASKEVEEVRVIRWGHAIPVMGPGYVTRVQPKLTQPEGRLFFAGVETQVPEVGAALYSGYYAAQQVREFLGRQAGAEKTR